jgi:hypothetical protein
MEAEEDCTTQELSSVYLQVTRIHLHSFDLERSVRKHV